MACPHDTDQLLAMESSAGKRAAGEVMHGPRFLLPSLKTLAKSPSNFVQDQINELYILYKNNIKLFDSHICKD